MNKALNMLLVVALIVGVLAVAGFALYDAWAQLVGLQAQRRLESQISLAEAAAEEARAVADRTREQAALAAAQAEVARAEGDADATRVQAEAGARVITAGATTINRQSLLFLFYGVLTPIGLAVTGVCLLVAGFAIGAMLSLGMALVIKTGLYQDIREILKERKRDALGE